MGHGASKNIGTIHNDLKQQRQCCHFTLFIFSGNHPGFSYWVLLQLLQDIALPDEGIDSDDRSLTHVCFFSESPCIDLGGSRWSITEEYENLSCLKGPGPCQETSPSHYASLVLIHTRFNPF